MWLPSADSGGDPEGLYYDVYAAQLNGEDPVFCRQNDEEIDCMCVCVCMSVCAYVYVGSVCVPLTVGACT